MTADLYILDTKVAMPNKVIQSVKSAEDIGKNTINLLKQKLMTTLQLSMTLSRKNFLQTIYSTEVLRKFSQSLYQRYETRKLISSCI